MLFQPKKKGGEGSADNEARKEAKAKDNSQDNWASSSVSITNERQCGKGNTCYENEDLQYLRKKVF